MQMRSGMWKRLAGGTIAGVTAVCLAGCSAQVASLPKILSQPFTDATPSVEEGFSAATGSAASSLVAPTIREDGVLTVGINTHSKGTFNAPMCYDDGEGHLAGMDIDLAAALADELGLKVKFVEVSDSDAGSAEAADIVMNCTADDLSQATMVGSYSESASAFFTKGAPGVVSVGDLNGKKVGVQRDSVSEQALNGTTLAMSRESFDNVSDAFEALEEGTVDYVLCDAYAGAYVSSHGYKDINFAGTLGEPVAHGFAILASNTSLQQAVLQALETVQSNGVYDVIRTRWVGQMPTLTADQQIANIPLAEQETEGEAQGAGDASADTGTTTDGSEGQSSAGDSSTATPGDTTAGANAITDVE